MNRFFLIKMLFFNLLFFSCLNVYSFTQLTLTEQLQSFVIAEKNKFALSALSLSVLLPTHKYPINIITGNIGLSNDQVISPNTLFQVGSITKTFTAALITEAIDQEHLSLDDKLSKYLPEYPKWQNITVRQLLNQTSGIFDYINSPGWWEQLAKHQTKIWTTKELVNLAYKHKNSFAPGTTWVYSNTNYVLLGMILEKATTQSFSQLIDHLIAENKLSNTFYLITPYSYNIFHRMAHGYHIDPNQSSDVTLIHGSWLQASGALVSNPNDLVKWQNIFLNSHGFLKKESLINTATGKKVKSFNETGYNFGTFRMNTPEGIILFTPGLTSGYTSMIFYAPCLDAYFSYSINTAKLKGFHQDMIMGLLNILNHDEGYKAYLTKNNLIPEYCKQILPAKKFQFPRIN